MTARVHRLPVINPHPVQLVLGLDGVGIRKRKRRRKAAIAPLPTPTDERAA